MLQPMLPDLISAVNQVQQSFSWLDPSFLAANQKSQTTSPTPAMPLMTRQENTSQGKSSAHGEQNCFRKRLHIDTSSKHTTAAQSLHYIKVLNAYASVIECFLTIIIINHSEAAGIAALSQYIDYLIFSNRSAAPEISLCSIFHSTEK